ncbi:MAG: SPOR domain-containing protein [Rhodobacteraceae bacterium]|nr:SPOR domain-containing protein [Paracoccaceae bacterium]
MSEANPYKTPPFGCAVASGSAVLRLATHWVISGVSVTVIAGFIYWAINLGTRDPHEVPIIRAMEGPGRTQPADPGGQTARHQGLAVNQVQSDGSVAAPAAEVVLAPPPDRLDDGDQPLGTAREAAAETATLQEDLQRVADPKPVKNRSAEPNDSIRGTELSPKTSLRPQGRPNLLRTGIDQVQGTVSASASSPAALSASVPTGTQMIQLGAYDSAELAQSEWVKLLEKNADLLEHKHQLVIRTESGGRTFYRLRAAGFNSPDESRALCTALEARETSCTPVMVR